MTGKLPIAAVVVILAASARTKADDAKGIAFFEAKIRPVLVQHCYDCHSAKAAKAEGSLQLDSRARIRTGGDRGPAVVPGNPQASTLFVAISHTDAHLKMPPQKDRLPPSL